MRDLGALERMICAFLLLAIHVKNGLSGFSPTNMKYVVCMYTYLYNLSLYFWLTWSVKLQVEFKITTTV